MRLTADNLEAAHAREIEVLLNGEPLEAVVVADEELGLAVILRRDTSGNAYRHAGARSRIATKTLRGRVELRLREDASPEAVEAYNAARKAERLAAIAADLDHSRRRPAGRRPTR